MPEISGLEVAARVEARGIASAGDYSHYIRACRISPDRALDSGARGYLLKDSPASELAGAVRRVHSGMRAVAPELAAEAWGENDPLTDRERQILRLAGEGISSAAIAAKFRLSEGTVRNYLSEAMSKLGASNRVEAARIARQKGWL